MNKGHYIIRIENAKDCNPEYAVQDNMPIECDSFVVVGCKDGKINGEGAFITVEKLSDMLTENRSVALVIRAACAMAEGKIKAAQIGKKYEALERGQELTKILSSLLNGKKE